MGKARLYTSLLVSVCLSKKLRWEDQFSNFAFQSFIKVFVIQNSIQKFHYIEFLSKKLRCADNFSEDTTQPFMKAFVIQNSILESHYIEFHEETIGNMPMTNRFDQPQQLSINEVLELLVGFTFAKLGQLLLQGFSAFAGTNPFL